MSKNNNKIFFIAFNNLINFTYNRYQILIKNFSSLENAFYQPLAKLIQAGWNQELALSFIKGRKEININNIIKKIKEENIKVVTIEDEEYPFLLSNIYNPPPILYYRGNLEIDWEKSLSVVGSRKFSFYGEKILTDFIPTLVGYDFNIISGLALGIDSLAHQKTIENQGITVAVLGSGLDYFSIYPRSNRGLLQNIISNNGLVLSEFPLGTKPLSFNFPIRNRIIAGLSRATLVVEASQKSGSLITANYALEEGREVFTFPGDIYNTNLVGNNILIKNGATTVLSPQDILDFFKIESDNLVDNKKYQGQNNIEIDILNIISDKERHIDDILESLPHDISQISSTLVILEMKGAIKDAGGKNYIKL